MNVIIRKEPLKVTEDGGYVNDGGRGGWWWWCEDNLGRRKWTAARGQLVLRSA